uniref:Uncharacterized protein n=1 Tax=Glyptapanteles indiensis TaxID=92994 RepID=B7S944_GLYIN|nr:conserved hypothetical protein [Glyptapanteles indiensis]
MRGRQYSLAFQFLIFFHGAHFDLISILSRVVIRKAPAALIMFMKITVPIEWKALPPVTLQKELVDTIATWYVTHDSWQGVKGTYNGVAAELIVDGYEWWFRKVNDKHTKPNQNFYSVAIIQC